MEEQCTLRIQASPRPRRQTQTHLNRSKRRGTNIKKSGRYSVVLEKPSSLIKPSSLLMASAFLGNNKHGHFVRVIQEIGRLNCAEKFRRLSGSIKGPLEVNEVSGSKVRSTAMLAFCLVFSSPTFSFKHRIGLNQSWFFYCCLPQYVRGKWMQSMLKGTHS